MADQARGMQTFLQGIDVAAGPERNRRRKRELKAEAQALLDQIEGKQPQPNALILDAEGYNLLMRSFVAARSEGKEVEALSELQRFVKILAGKKRGRPPGISDKQLDEMRRLQQQGLGYGAIARRMGLKKGRQLVRTTLEREFKAP